MCSVRKLVMICLALALLFGGLGYTPRPAQAASCVQFHYVRYRENLRQLASYYGVSKRYLQNINNLESPRDLKPGDKLCLAWNAGSVITPPFKIREIIRGEQITIQGTGFPIDDTLRVSMGDPIRKENPVLVELTAINVGDDGRFRATYDLPDALKEYDRLGIRLESQEYDFYTYRLFSNIDSAPTGYHEPPYIRVISVDPGKSVTFVTENMRPNTTFEVWMKPYGVPRMDDLAMDLGAWESGDGGSLVVTLSIPPELSSFEWLGVHLENMELDYHLHQWFYNGK